MWAAPSILTLDAAAAASCGTGTHTMAWSQKADNSGPGVFTSTGGTGSPNVTVGTNNSATNPANSGGGGSLGNNWTVVNNGTQVGNQTAAFWYMQMKATAGGSAQWLETTFTFAKSVVGLSFTVFDVDIGNAGNTWTDIVSVTGKNAANVQQNVTVTKAGGTGSPTLAGSGTTTASATGAANVGTNSTVGNVTFSIATAVNSVTVRFAAGVVTNPIQYVGIGNLTWTSCV